MIGRIHGFHSCNFGRIQNNWIYFFSIIHRKLSIIYEGSSTCKENSIETKQIQIHEHLRHSVHAFHLYIQLIINCFFCIFPMMAEWLSGLRRGIERENVSVRRGREFKSPLRNWQSWFLRSISWCLVTKDMCQLTNLCFGIPTFSLSLQTVQKVLYWSFINTYNSLE